MSARFKAKINYARLLRNISLMIQIKLFYAHFLDGFWRVFSSHNPLFLFSLPHRLSLLPVSWWTRNNLHTKTCLARIINLKWLIASRRPGKASYDNECQSKTTRFWNRRKCVDFPVNERENLPSIIICILFRASRMLNKSLSVLLAMWDDNTSQNVLLSFILIFK